MKYIFNWTSGTGGDFILGLRECLLKNTLTKGKITVCQRNNKWDLDLPAPLIRKVRLISSAQLEDVYNKIQKLPVDQVAQMHNLNKMIVKYPELSELLKNNIEYSIVYLISGSNVSDYVAKLASIKNKEQYTEDYYNQLMMENKVSGIEWSNVTVIEYDKIFINNDHFEIQKLFASLGVTSMDIEQVSEVIRLYSLLNEKIIDGEVHPDVDGPNEVAVRSIPEIKSILKKSL